ncbi:MAG: ABC transporter permease, partial [Vicinamibacterales bacterium]
MLRNLARLGRYRGLIHSLVARELKARYRGSVLGFFWSFINPLLLLLVYSFVFGYVMPQSKDERVDPYALFMFCGILPWTWFSSSLAESSGVLISGGNLIKKVLFPAEILPIVTVLANMVHYFFGLVILAGFLIYYQRPLNLSELAIFPLVVLVQLVLTLGFALILSALTVHFRDIRDILSNLLTFWFFATPIIYFYNLPTVQQFRWLFDFNPFFHLVVSYQEILFFDGPFWEGHLLWLLALGVASCGLFV